jgi:peptidyl-tRNA hydrolase
MRNDLASLNAGKAMAQASHASNAFLFNLVNDPSKADYKDLVEEWISTTTQGFGTVFVLAVNEEQLNKAIDLADADGFATNIITDPTYPIKDGDVTHHLPLDTCGYIFGDHEDPMLRLITQDLELYP